MSTRAFERGVCANAITKSFRVLALSRFFKKTKEILYLPQSVRPSVRPLCYLLNHWTKSNHSHEWGMQRHMFGPSTWGPGEGPKGQYH